MRKSKYLVRPNDMHIFEVDESNGCYRSYTNKSVTRMDGTRPEAQDHFTYENLTEDYHFFPIPEDELPMYEHFGNIHTKYISWACRPDGHGGSKGGTILAALTAIIGRRVQLIVPVGLEKRAFEDVNVIAQRCNARDAEGPRLMPMPGEVLSEIEALKLLAGVEAHLISAGGVYGAEGAVRLGINGSETQNETAGALIESLANEPPCRA